MARRRHGASDDLLSLASKLPWKVSLGLAAVSLAVLHLIARAFNQPTAATALGNLGGVVTRQYIHVLAQILQFVIPAGLLIGTAVSLIKRSRSLSLIDDVRSTAGRDVSSLSWQEFESLVGEGFRQRGFEVTERGAQRPTAASI